jgi:hydroxypyruvate reductase
LNLRFEDHQSHFAEIQSAALRAADPARAVSRALGTPAAARVFLVALGKASLGMTSAALEKLGDRVVAGVVAYPHAMAPPADWPAKVRAIGAGHPFPDAGSLSAGAEAWRMLGDCKRGDLVLVLISGGGSALFEHLRPGVTLEDLAALTRDLQRAGADIHELNTVRRALSLVKGGGLARRAGDADVLALLLSDVMGDNLADIASGPTVASPTGPADAWRVLQTPGLAGRYPALEAVLREPADTGPVKSNTRIIGSNRMSVEAARERAADLGFHSSIWDPAIRGEARVLGERIGNAAGALPETPGANLPACFVLGGETTVTVKGDGVGGRNTELALAAALALENVPKVAVMTLATDGVDGSSQDAGAIVTGDTVAHARALGLSAEDALARNDSATFFDKLGDAVKTGPTGTNVNDLVIVLAYV